VLGDAVSAAVAPGWSVWRRSRPLAVGLFLLGWGIPLGVVGFAVGQRRTWVALTLDSSFLALVVVAGAAAAAARLVALGEVWWAHGRPALFGRRTSAGLAVVTVVVTGLTYGTVAVERARAALAPVFAGQLDVPLFDAGEATMPVVEAAPVPVLSGEPATAATKGGRWKVANPPADTRACPVSGVDPASHPDVATILLLGGDAGPGGRGAIDHFALSVPSHDVLVRVEQRLRDAGAQEVGEIQRLGSEWSLFFRDPDGMELEVCCPAD